MPLAQKFDNSAPAILALHDRGGFLAFDDTECKAAGERLSQQYQSALPFPHIVLENIVSKEVLRKIFSECPDSGRKTYYNRAQERLKYQYGPGDWTGVITHNLFAALNSQAFLNFLEKMTGIEGLLVDASFDGGGLHEIKAGGHLGIHADFNILTRKNLLRRLNLLIYLNDEWSPDFGGNLELWDKGMKGCELSIPPLLGKAVVFSTNSDSFHGHPEPLTCPPDRSRRSMALYYYTAPKEGIAGMAQRTTDFKVRPGTTDKTDWQNKLRHLARDWIPPAIHQMWRRLTWRFK